MAPADPGLARSESPSAAEKAEDASTLTTNGTLIQDLSEASEEPEEQMTGSVPLLLDLSAQAL